MCGKGGGGSTEIETTQCSMPFQFLGRGKGGGGSTEIETKRNYNLSKVANWWQGWWWLN